MAKERNGERGQALVEFSLVLPVLVIFIIGSVLLGIYFTQRSTMTGITFIAAREAALSAEAGAAASRVQRDFARGGPNWLKDAKMKTATGSREVAVTMTQSGNMNVPLLAAAGQAVAPGSKPLDRFADLQETVLMSTEVVRRPGSHGHHPKTANVIDYRRKLGLKIGDVDLTPQVETLEKIAPSLLGQVAPHAGELDDKARHAAASGCAEIVSGGCPDGPGNQNLHGPKGFFGQMGFKPSTGTVDGTVPQDLLPTLRAGQTLQNIKAVTAIKTWLALPGNEGLATFLRSFKELAGEAKKGFKAVAGLSDKANQATFDPVSLLQYQQGQR